MAGIPGTAVAVAAVGGLLVYAGIVDAPLLDAVRAVAGGQPPAGRPAKRTDVQWVSGLGSAVAEAGAAGAEAAAGIISGGRAGSAVAGGSSRGGAIVAAARRYAGRPYRWGATGPDAFDCSGLVWRALTEAGISHRRLTSHGYRAWSAATTVPRDQAAPGDLVCYVGHIGIMTGPGRMIHAPRPGAVVHERDIYSGPGGPVYRRVRG